MFDGVGAVLVALLLLAVCVMGTLRVASLACWWSPHTTPTTSSIVVCVTTTLPATSCPVHITLGLCDDVGVVLVPLIRLILMMHQMIVVHQTHFLSVYFFSVPTNGPRKAQHGAP